VMTKVDNIARSQHVAAATAADVIRLDSHTVKELSVYYAFKLLNDAETN